MTILKDYDQFSGRHYETGSVHNLLAYQGVNGPHNDQPLSEALLLGISGGITFGYFLFHYEGFAPQLALLTRNTFEPLDRLLARLGIVQERLQTASADKAHQNLIDTLENGQAALVWADRMSLPYNAALQRDDYWDMQPLVVYGHDGDQAFIADRSSQPLTAGADELAAARGRIKKDKHRLITLHLPSLDKLPSAVSQGIWDCIRLFTEAPPKGSPKNFGLAAFDHWAEMLVNTRNKQSWARFFPRGAGFFSALAGNEYSPGLYGWVQHYGAAGGAERGLYADFLEEAAQILDRPALEEAAASWRASASAWEELGTLALPADAELLNEARRLLDESQRLFIEQGVGSVERRRAIGQQLTSLRQQAESDFPLDEEAAAQLRASLREQVLAIRDQEAQALEEMQAAMA